MQSMQNKLKVIANSSCESGPVSSFHLVVGFILLVKTSLNIS